MKCFGAAELAATLLTGCANPGVTSQTAISADVGTGAR